MKFDFALGESFYNPWLGEVVADLLARGIARESEGAVGVFSDGSLPPKEDPFLVNRDGEWIRRSRARAQERRRFQLHDHRSRDVDYRLKTWSPDEIVYVVDDRQSGHFKKLFLIFARWKPDAAKTTKLVHVGFGKILGDDGKPFKTRSGDTVKLGDLLDEAEERAFKIVSEKSPGSAGSAAPGNRPRHRPRRGEIRRPAAEPPERLHFQLGQDARAARQHRAVSAICLRAHQKHFPQSRSQQLTQLATSALQLAAPEEFALAKHLLNFGLTLEAVAEEYRPNFLCNYLYELAGKFTSFYENCPVLKADDAATRDSRLALCDLTARVLKQGLDVLGIEVVEQM